MAPAEDGFVRLHGVLEASHGNGPGVRSVIWFQGCTLGCRGCFNPATHAPGGGARRQVRDLVAEIADRQREISGVTISGGEPLQQPRALRALVTGLRARTELSILLFSGYRRAEIDAMHDGPAVLAHIDVLIAGRYVPSRPSGEALLGSGNQQVHLLTSRYSLSDLRHTPPGEVVIDPDGRITITGIDPPAMSAR